MDSERWNIEKYIIKKCEEKGELIGRSKIQHIMNILYCLNLVDLKEVLFYHFGPYSPLVDVDLMKMKQKEIIQMSWVEYKDYYGYTIKLNKKDNIDIDEKYKPIIDELLEFSNNELNILSTSLFLFIRIGIKDKEELVNEIHKIQPHRDKKIIEKIVNNDLPKILSFS